MTPIVQTIVLALSDIRSWTWRAILALLLIVVAYVVPRLTSTTLGLQDILDVGNLVGAGLLTIEMARARQQTPPAPAPAPTNERGHAGVGLLASMVVLALVPLLLSQAGCASREIITADPIDIECWVGPPCRCHITAGTTEPYIVRNPKGSPRTCTIKVP